MSKENEAAPRSTGPEDHWLEDTERQISKKWATKYNGGSGLWSDGFLSFFVKQKEDSVWTLMVTTPDRGGSAPSK